MENKPTRPVASSEIRSKPFIPSYYREEVLRELKGAPLSVHMAYLSFANKDGWAWPSLRKLAAVTGYGINAVKDAKRFLIEIGLLKPEEQARSGGKFGLKRFQVCTVVRKPDHGTVDPSTVARSTVARKQCQEGSPSEGSPSEGDPADAVRRRDAELPAAIALLEQKQKPNSNPKFSRPEAELLVRCALASWDDSDHKVFVFTKLGKTLIERMKTRNSNTPLDEQKPTQGKRRLKLTERLAGKIENDDDRFSSHVELCKKKGWAHPYGTEERAAFKAVQYEPDLESTDLSFSFVASVVDVYEKHKNENVSPGNLCSKVMDHCTTERQRSIKLGGGSNGYYWPHSFQLHRDHLREQEREVEQKAGQEARA